MDRELKDSTLDEISRSEVGIRWRLSTSSHALCEENGKNS